MSRHPRRPGTGERRFRIIVSTLLLAVVISSVPAAAGGPALGWMGDEFTGVTNSEGIKLGQFEMSMDDGGVTHPLRAMWASIIKLCWNSYLMVIAVLCRLLDWTVSMNWVGWITGPVVGLQNEFRDKVMAPIGANSWGGTILVLLTTCAGVAVAVKMMSGRSASAWATAARASIAAALAMGVLAAPVSTFAGDSTQLATPLARSQQLGVALTRMIVDSDDPGTVKAEDVSIADDKTSTGDDSTPKLSAIIMDSFVSPVHQQLNYGRIIDAKCHDKYVEVLKGGPYDDISDARDKIGECDDGLKDYAGGIADGPWLVGFYFYSAGAAGLMLLLLIFAALCWFYVVKLVWSAFLSMINALRAIPGPSDPLIRDLVSVLYALIGFIGSMMMLGIVLLIIKTVFSSDGNVVVKFLAVNLIEGLGVVAFFVAMWRRHKGEKSLRARFGEWMRSKRSQTTPVIGRWAAKGTRRMVRSAGRKLGGGAQGARGAGYAPTGQGGHAGGRAGGGGVRFTGQPAMTRVALSGAAAMATGGASTGVTRAAKVARMASAAQRAVASYGQIRTGGGAPEGQSKIATAGMSAVAHAHNHVSALRHGMASVASSTRQGKPVRATTGHRSLDATAMAAGHVEANVVKGGKAVAKPVVKGGKAVAKPAVKGGKAVAKPVVKGGKAVAKPVVKTAQAVRHVVTPPTPQQAARHGIEPVQPTESKRIGTQKSPDKAVTKVPAASRQARRATPAKEASARAASYAQKSSQTTKPSTTPTPASSSMPKASSSRPRPAGHRSVTPSVSTHRRRPLKPVRDVQR